MAAQRQALAGHRVEFDPASRLLWLRPPQGQPDHIALDSVQMLWLHRLDARDTRDGQARYFWLVRNQARTLSIPYFATEPASLLEQLKPALPGLDIERALRQASGFERDRFDLCPIWAAPDSPELKADKDYSLCRG